MTTDGGQSVDGTDDRLTREVRDCTASQSALLDHLRSLDDVRPQRQSQLEGWSVGHVLTHLTCNADSYRSLLEDRPQYEGGWNQRDADIDAGSGRGWSTLVADLSTACDRLDAAFAQVEDWNHRVPMLTGSQPARFLPRAHRREVEVHRVDLGLGYTFEEIPDDFVTADVELLQRWWELGADGATPLPAPIAKLAPRD